MQLQAYKVYSTALHRNVSGKSFKFNWLRELDHFLTKKKN